jgi:catalase (peroxidase I)
VNSEEVAKKKATIEGDGSVRWGHGHTSLALEEEREERSQLRADIANIAMGLVCLLEFQAATDSNPFLKEKAGELAAGFTEMTKRYTDG